MALDLEIAKTRMDKNDYYLSVARAISYGSSCNPGKQHGCIKYPYVIIDSITKITIYFRGSPYIVIIDTKNLIRLVGYYITLKKNRNQLVVRIEKQVKTIGPKNYQLSRYLSNAPNDYWVDHINCNTLDNREENYRFVTQAQSAQNRSLNSNSSSGVRGVNFETNTNKWRARVAINGVRITLGRYSSKEEAELVVKTYRAKNMPFSKDYLEAHSAN